MSVPRSVAEVMRDHVTLEVEGIDRMYLNVYQPKLQTEKQAACFFRFHRGQPVASSSLMGVMTKEFLAKVDAFVEQHQIPVVHFKKGQRKDDVAADYRARLPKSHRYRVTEQGWRTILFCTRCYNRLLRPGLAQLLPGAAVSINSTRNSRSGLQNKTLPHET